MTLVLLVQRVLLKWRLKLRGLFKAKKSEVEKLQSEEQKKELNGKKQENGQGEGEEEEEDIDTEIKNALDSEKKWEKK